MAPTEREPELDYLRRVEALAHDVVEQAGAAGWLAFGPAGQEDADPGHRAVNALATELRMVHTEGDGCLDH